MSETLLPPLTGTLPNALSTGGASSHLYVLTQWGFARASLADPANPSNWSILHVGDPSGSPRGGVIPITADHHQGPGMMAVAEAPDGSSRMISDWWPGDSSAQYGLRGQVARTVGSRQIRYGGQVDLPFLPHGRKLAAVYSSTTDSCFGYFPTESAGIQIADLTVADGSTDRTKAIRPFAGPRWNSAFALHAAVVGNEVLLACATNNGTMLRIARIDPATGQALGFAATATSRAPLALAFGVVNGRIYVFAAEQTEGLRIYELTGGMISPTTHIPGNFDLVVVKGDPPVIFAHRRTPAMSFVDVYDARVIVTGGSRFLSLPHFGGVEGIRRGLEAIVRLNTAYVYRQLGPAAIGEEMRIRTDVVDISALGGGATPLPPPAPPMPTSEPEPEPEPAAPLPPEPAAPPEPPPPAPKPPVEPAQPAAPPPTGEPTMPTGEGQWVSVDDRGAIGILVAQGWVVGFVDMTSRQVWVAPPGPASPDLNKPWPGRPQSETPRASYRSDGTVRSSGYLPSGQYVEAQETLVYTCPLCGGTGTLGGAA